MGHFITCFQVDVIFPRNTYLFSLKVLSLILLFVSGISISFASSGAGNGGDAVVCKDSVELLDVYEARQMHLELDLGSSPTYRNMILFVTNKLKEKDLYLANLLEKYSLEMVSEFELFQKDPEARGKFVNLGPLEITEVNDSNHVAIPLGCKLIQLVNQREPEFSLQFRYTINEELWNRMDIENQAMTILHEAWYRIMIEHGATTSQSSRFMNALVASSYLETISFTQYFNDLKKTELKYYKVVNSSLTIRSPYLKINMAKYILEYDEENDFICVPRFIFTTNFMRNNHRMKTPFKEVCFSNSRVRSLKFSSTFSNKSFSIEMSNYVLKMNKASVIHPVMHFHENGKLMRFEGISINSIIKSNGRVYKRPVNIEFDTNEMPLNL